MKKLLVILVAMAFAVVSCENAGQKNETSDADNKAVVEELALIQLQDFEEKAGDFVGKKIQLKGTVDHVCTHGGQRMFIVNQDSDARIKVTPDEEIAAFNTNLEGSSVHIVGVVEEMRIDEAYIMEWEEEIKSGESMSDDKGEGTHLGGKMEKGGEHADVSEEMQKVLNLRKMLEESGSDHLSFYSVLCTDYKVVEAGDGHDHDGHNHDGHDHSGHDHD